MLQTHGLSDPLLMHSIAVELRDLMSSAGMTVEWRQFRGGHEIPPDVMDAVGRFVTRVTASDDRS